METVGEKKPKHEKTLRQKQLAKNLLCENVRTSRQKAMIDAGYSPSYAATSNIKKTKTWTELMNEFLPEDLLAKTHNELLGASHIDHYDFPKGDKKNLLSDEEIKAVVESVPGCKLIYIKPAQSVKTAYFSNPDSKIRKDAIDLAYKNRGLYAAEKIEVKTKLQQLSNKELAEHIAKQKNFFKKK